MPGSQNLVPDGRQMVALELSKVRIPGNCGVRHQVSGGRKITVEDKPTSQNGV